ncbi:hypothetical protein OAA91_00885 [Fibrobacterales bacterium]|nr:hypothetical protein [Fibrobacterales bacterium]
MARLSLSDLKEGMVLEKPALANGRVILGEGMELTKKHLNIFKTWGVNEIYVVGDSADLLQGDKKIPEADFEKIEAHVKKRFKLCCPSENEVITQLEAVALKSEIAIYWNAQGQD